MQDKFLISRSIAWQIEQSEGFLYVYDNQTDDYFKLDGTAKQIWLLLCKNKNVKEIIDVLSEKYQADVKEIENDVTDFIQQLLMNNLIMLISDTK